MTESRSTGSAGFQPALPRFVTTIAAETVAQGGVRGALFTLNFEGRV
jgi:hypothetical protein